MKNSIRYFYRGRFVLEILYQTPIVTTIVVRGIGAINQMTNVLNPNQRMKVNFVLK